MIWNSVLLFYYTVCPRRLGHFHTVSCQIKIGQDFYRTCIFFFKIYPLNTDKRLILVLNDSDHIIDKDRPSRGAQLLTNMKRERRTSRRIDNLTIRIAVKKKLI